MYLILLIWLQPQLLCLHLNTIYPSFMEMALYQSMKISLPFLMSVITLGKIRMALVCVSFSTHWKGKLQLTSLNYHQMFSQLWLNCHIGLSLHMDNLKVEQTSSNNIIILFITRVKWSNLSTRVSLNCIIKS
jgi:hypothetical protein